MFVGQPGLLICLSDAPDRPPPSLADGELTRANPLNGLAGVLPLERPDQWAALFTDKDIVTLRHRTEQRMGENCARVPPIASTSKPGRSPVLDHPSPGWPVWARGEASGLGNRKTPGPSPKDPTASACQSRSSGPTMRHRRGVPRR